jgi:hypothetical protein
MPATRTPRSKPSPSKSKHTKRKSDVSETTGFPDQSASAASEAGECPTSAPKKPRTTSKKTSVSAAAALDKFSQILEPYGGLPPSPDACQIIVKKMFDIIHGASESAEQAKAAAKPVFSIPKCFLADHNIARN